MRRISSASLGEKSSRMARRWDSAVGESGATSGMPEAAARGVRPRYLNDAAAALPDTCVEAVRLETLHLFGNAFEKMWKEMA